MNDTPASSPAPLAIVGIGASAGGLEALKELVASIAPDTGLCFVIVQHLAPDHPSIMDKLLAEQTTLPVTMIRDGMAAAPDAIFVIPPDASLTIDETRFQLGPRAKNEGVRTPIDKFLVSLAEAHGEAAACVILSGTGSDGTAGLRAIKAHGGIAVAQSHASARFSGMPDSASATGLVDFQLEPRRIAPRLSEVLRHRDHMISDAAGPRLRESIAERLSVILEILADGGDGHDFASYKEGTLVRRVERRMAVLRLRSVDELCERLRHNRSERTQLLQDFLIGVTQFFRNPDSFEILAERIVPEILGRGERDIRVWVPGCSTGEETYTLAMLFHAAMEAQGDMRRLQVFGTDIDIEALRQARSGRYAAGALAAVPEGYRHRYFTRDDDGYAVRPMLREAVVFAPHNILRDPPFSRIDLISCRNVLIYLAREGQRSAFSRFHYALRPAGFLFLGSSEAVTENEDKFLPIERQHRLFRRDDRQPSAYSALSDRHEAFRHARPTLAENPMPASPTSDQTLEAAADRFFLTRFSKPYVVVNARNEVRYLSSNAGALVSPTRGQPNADLESLLAQELRTPVRMLLEEVREKAGPAAVTDVVLRSGDTLRLLDIHADLLPGDTGHIMLAFAPVRLENSDDLEQLAERRHTEAAAEVEHELELTRRSLHATKADYDAVTQDLRSANEELLSMNEEMQSANEELETSREELQSINEELETINAELSENNQLLTTTNSDLRNVMESTDIPIVILSDDLELRRFTRAAKALFNMDDRDIGRRITDLSWSVDYPEIVQDVASVRDTLQVVERHVEARGVGAVYQARVRPYRSVDDRLDGSVITMVDITQQLSTQRNLRESEDRLNAALRAGKLGVHEFDPRTGKVQWDATVRSIWGVGPDIEIDYEVFKAGLHADDIGNVEARVAAALDPSGPGRFEADYRVIHARSGETIWVHADGDVTFDNGSAVRLVGTARDITRERAMLDEIRDNATRLELTYEVTGIAAFHWNANTDQSKWTTNLFEMLGCDPNIEPSFAVFDSFVHPDDRDRVNAAVAEALEKRTLFDQSFRIRRGTDGAERVIAGKGRGVYDETGAPAGMIGINFDRTGEVRDRAHRELLTNELNHRVKNSLATIQAIALQTLRTAETLDSFAEKFLGRLKAIALAHDILVAGATADTTLASLITAQVAPYAGSSEKRLHVSGPALDVDATVAHAIGLVLHELATNAAKYGALSNETGRVTIKWRDVTVAEVPGLEIRWEEAGGPRVAQPGDRGFGTKLIETTLSFSLGGDCALDYAADGLKATIRAPRRAEHD